jgi:hypothetical protein
LHVGLEAVELHALGQAQNVAKLWHRGHDRCGDDDCSALGGDPRLCNGRHRRRASRCRAKL